MQTHKVLIAGAYWRFARFVMRQARHIMDAESQSFINEVVETCKKRVRKIPKGTALWRAQLGHSMRMEPILDEVGDVVDEFETEAPWEPDRMVPFLDRAYEGRVNPKGIPCLYLSTDRDTSMTETRPWIGSYVTVCQFVMLRDLTVVDCTADPLPVIPPALQGEERKAATREGLAWKAINKAFSKPVTRSDDLAGYAPTQVLAEAFRSAGYEGIFYGSKVGKGKTVAAFDLKVAKQANAFLFQVDNINVAFTEAANPYFLEGIADTPTT